MAFSLKAILGMDAKPFERGMDRAKRKVSSAAKGMLTSLAPIAGFVGFATLGRNATQLAADIENLSRISGANAEEFQKASFGAKTLGVEQDKLADIFKDTNDKIGDFLTTGAGPMADFFEQIAPKVGITAEAFRGLSGPDALQLYFDSLEKANLSQQEMTFYMEAVASDATALIPLLKNGGKGFKKFADEADRAGQVMDGQTIKKLKIASDRIDAFQRAVTILAAKGIAPLVPVLVSFTEFLTRNGESIWRTTKNLLAFIVGLKSAKFVIPATTKLIGVFTIASQGAAGALVTLRVAVAVLKNSLRVLAASTGVGLLFVGLSVAAEKLYLHFSKNKEAADDLGDELNDAKRSSDEFSKALQDQVRQLGRSSKAVEASTRTLEEYQEGIQKIKDLIRDRPLTLEENRMRQMELSLLQAQANGESEKAEKLKEYIRLSEQALKIAKDHNISLERARKLVKGIRENEESGAEGVSGAGTGRIGGQGRAAEEQKIRDMRLEAMKADATGQTDVAKALQNRIKLAERILQIERETGATRREAILIANQQVRKEIGARQLTNEELAAFRVEPAANGPASLEGRSTRPADVSEATRTRNGSADTSNPVVVAVHEVRDEVKQLRTDPAN